MGRRRVEGVLLVVEGGECWSLLIGLMARVIV